MMMKKLAIASAIALMGMGSVYAQSTPAETVAPASNAVDLATVGQAESSTGLMTTLSNSVGSLFNASNTTSRLTGTPAVYVTTADPYYTAMSAADKLAQSKVVLINGDYVPYDVDLHAGRTQYILKTPASAGFGSIVETIGKAVDITALGGAVNLASINGGINITGVNVTLTGIANTVGAAAATGLSTTVIGAMNSSTLEIAKMTQTLSDKTASTLNIAGLANQGPGPTITSQDFGPGQLSLATKGNAILASAAGSAQFDMTGLTSSTDTLSSSLTDKLQSMNVFNMAVNMAPLVASVNIAATMNKDAWFLNPDNGSVKLAGLTAATTAIGAMNSSITKLGTALTK
ncbi:hypothetical protein [Polaromonas sp.]|uniref:hypothetical protein n=1 Tax=Polaromonas sp. TaxID=1869339 RepID=UPI0013B9B639|nr:hypothetical protein [Polaromonas sp.]NDP65035.1 hypothetical protein [Polaromonas sp.]